MTTIFLKVSCDDEYADSYPAALCINLTESLLSKVQEWSKLINSDKSIDCIRGYARDSYSPNWLTEIPEGHETMGLSDLLDEFSYDDRLEFTELEVNQYGFKFRGGIKHTNIEFYSDDYGVDNLLREAA